MSVVNLRSPKYQFDEVDIVNNTDIFFISFESNHLYEKIKGISLLYVPLSGTPNPDFLKFKKFEIQNREIYPFNFYAKNLDTSNDVPFNEKFDIDIDEPAKASKVYIELKDDSVAFTGSYRVVVTLKLINA